MSVKATLLEAPLELQQHVMSYADDKDILSMRITCRTMAAAMDELFLVAFYSKRRHLITRHALEYLATIAKDVRLRSKLTEIELVVTELNEDMNPDDAGYDTSPGVKFTWRQTLLYRQASPITFEQFKAEDKGRWARWLVEREAVRSSATADLLATALPHLSRAESFPKLTLTAGTPAAGHDLKPTFGMRQLMRNIEIEATPEARLAAEKVILQQNYNMCQAGATLAVRNVMCAISSSSFCVRELDVEVECGFGEFDVSQPILEGLNGGIASSLAAVSLRMPPCAGESEQWFSQGAAGPLSHDSEGHEAGQFLRGMTALSTIMHNARNLRELSLFFNPLSLLASSSVSSKIRLPFTSNSLTTINLVCGKFSGDVLLDILYDHQSTLKQLGLCRIDLGDKTICRRVLRRIADEFELERCDVYSLFAGGSLMAAKAWNHTDGPFYGAAVKPGLHNLADKLEFRSWLEQHDSEDDDDGDDEEEEDDYEEDDEEEDDEEYDEDEDEEEDDE